MLLSGSLFVCLGFKVYLYNRPVVALGLKFCILEIVALRYPACFFRKLGWTSQFKDHLVKRCEMIKKKKKSAIHRFCTCKTLGDIHMNILCIYIPCIFLN